MCVWNFFHQQYDLFARFIFLSRDFWAFWDDIPKREAPTVPGRSYWMDDCFHLTSEKGILSFIYLFDCNQDFLGEDSVVFLFFLMWLLCMFLAEKPSTQRFLDARLSTSIRVPRICGYHKSKKNTTSDIHGTRLFTICAK